MTDAAIADSSDTHEADEHHAHEGEAFSGHETMYIKIALRPGGPHRGMEVALALHSIDDGPVLMWPLLVVMSIKFVVIAAFFMHLKFDSIILTRVFYAGLFLAVAVYVIALTTLHVFGW